MQIITPEKVGNYIKKRRILKGYSSKELARLLGSTPVYICRLQRYPNTPSPNMLKKLCEILDMDFIYLLSVYKIIILERFKKKLNEKYGGS